MNDHNVNIKLQTLFPGTLNSAQGGCFTFNF